MVTESIKDYAFALNSLDDCKELTVNKLDIDGNILSVDLNDLYNFKNLKSLSLCNMTIGENDLLILKSLNNLKTLKLYNCDFSNNDLFNYFNDLTIDELVLDNTEINFNLIKKHFKNVIVKNISNIYNINADCLNISKSLIVDFNNLKTNEYKKLIVNKNQYLKNQQLLKNSNIEVVNEYYDEVGDIYE